MEPVVAAETTSTELFERFLRLSVADGAASERTIRAYREGFALFFGWCKDNRLHPETVSYENLEAYRRWLVTKYKRATVGLRLVAVRALYQALQRWGRRLDNPAAGLKTPKDRTGRVERLIPKALSPEEVRRFLGVLPYPHKSIAAARDRAMIDLMLWHGLRAEEVVLLRPEWLDTQGFTWIDVRGKGQKQRRIFLCRDSRISMMAWMERRGLFLFDRALFHRLDSPTAEFLTVRTIERIVDKYLHAAFIKRPGRSAHCLRHTAALLAALGGAPREAIAEAFGHVSTTTTDLYLRAAARYQANPAEAAHRVIHNSEGNNMANKQERVGTGLDKEGRDVVLYLEGDRTQLFVVRTADGQRITHSDSVKGLEAAGFIFEAEKKPETVPPVVTPVSGADAGKPTPTTPQADVSGKEPEGQVVDAEVTDEETEAKAKISEPQEEQAPQEEAAAS